MLAFCVSSILEGSSKSRTYSNSEFAPASTVVVKLLAVSPDKEEVPV
ncbi:MAG: Uncharacterised protein [Flavobacterium sp. SCGC AAA160-P02]|nr:MAG: Uncharacterised protein [Flavobacterium sp. SCGC AAA160-P02]